jgi:DNA-binding beta-propeller fold protein YncE
MRYLFFICLLSFVGFFSHSSISKKTIPNKVSSATNNNKNYNDIVFQKEEVLKSSGGTKSVIFNSKGSKLYAMNLEGLSVYEFDRESKKLTRQFKFKPHRGIGWDYQTKLPVPSWQEKPVEACFSNEDKILWVSLHNAQGIVPIKIDDNFHCPITWDTSLTKLITITNVDGSSYKIDAPLIKTGLTPKVIAVTNNNNLLVSNWHSKTVSILNINNNSFPFAKLIKDIKVEAIPRGISIDEKSGKSFIAIMGSNSIAVVNNKTWALEKYIKVLANPRHIVLGDDNKMFVSFNCLNQVACINTNTGNTLFSYPTHLNPRSIVLSKNKKFLFVTCYNSNTLDIFKIIDNGFVPMYSLNCPGKPVGIDLYENDNKIEAWVCNYVGGSLKVFTFNKGQL